MNIEAPTDNQIDKRLAEFEGWKELELSPAGMFHGITPDGNKSMLKIRYTESIDATIPLVERYGCDLEFCWYSGDERMYGARLNNLGDFTDNSCPAKALALSLYNNLEES
ncbi:hypothetical protein N9948_00780 [bacterium]|nr:hypothetical protein [bacterium]